jgi:predicted transcriptional regulator of viral defense system
MFCIIIHIMKTQSDKALALLGQHGIARAHELLAQGITATTISRMEQNGLIMQIARGLYQLSSVTEENRDPLALATKLVPKGIICLNSSLAFHGLGEATPFTWIGIGPREWRPRLTNRFIQVCRFSPKSFDIGWHTYDVDGIAVRVYEPAKTLADLFKSARDQQLLYKSKTGIMKAVNATKVSLRQRKATRSAIIKYAEQIGIWKFMEPYLDALIAGA